MEKQYKVGVVGATGMVGQRFIPELSGTFNKPSCVCCQQAHFVFVYYYTTMREEFFHYV